MTVQLLDNDIIKLYLETQNPSYFSELYDRYVDRVYGKCLSLLKEPALAQDACQDIFMKIFTRLSTFNQKSKFSTWVYAVTYNYCIDLIRKQKKENTISAGEDWTFTDEAEEVSDKDLLEMELERLGIALNKVSVEDKAVLLMKYREDLSIKEICDILGKSESAIKMKLKRAKQKVRTQYERLLVASIIGAIIIIWIL